MVTSNTVILTAGARLRPHQVPNVPNFDMQNVYFLISHDGLRTDSNSAEVPTMSLGRRLTLYAPARIASRWTVEMPLRLLRMLPESLPVSPNLNRPGGAKSSAVNVPETRREWLSRALVGWDMIIGQEVNLRARHDSEIVKAAC